MYRSNEQVRKIAYKILGVPANIAFKPTKKQQEIDRKLIADETVRAR